jgi:hypothetical protein
MATKTFKIGEYCKGGVITVETTKKEVSVIAKEWDYSKGCSKGSDQKNAKEFDRKTVKLNEQNAERTLMFFIHDLTTSYYTDMILDWIKTKVKFNYNQWDFDN